MNNNDVVWYRLKASGKEFRICVEETNRVVWRFRYSIVDNVDNPADLEAVSNWKRTQLPTEPPKDDDAQPLWWGVV